MEVGREEQLATVGRGDGESGVLGALVPVVEREDLWSAATAGLQPEIVPSMVAKRKFGEADLPSSEMTKPPVPPLNTCPVGIGARGKSSGVAMVIAVCPATGKGSPTLL